MHGLVGHNGSSGYTAIVDGQPRGTESAERRRTRGDSHWLSERRRNKESHHSVPRNSRAADIKASSKPSPAHSLDRLVRDSSRPQRPSRLDFVNSNDVFLTVAKTKRIPTRPSSPETCEQGCLCMHNSRDTIPRKYEDLGDPDFSWAFKNSERNSEKPCDHVQEDRDHRTTSSLEKPSPAHSDDGNSPTALNTCRLLADKPPLVKTLQLDYVDHGFSPRRIHSGTPEKGRLSAPLHRDPQSSLPPLPTDNPPSGQTAHLAEDNGHRTIDLPPELADLKTAPWFQASLPREAALLLLSRQPEGSFLVRCSTSQRDCLALSLRVPRDVRPCGLAHYLIVRSPRGYRIKGFTKEFGSVRSLVTHHSVMPELLPVPLSLARPQQTRDSSGNFVDLSDPDYNSIADFRKLMADLHV